MKSLPFWDFGGFVIFHWWFCPHNSFKTYRKREAKISGIEDKWLLMIFSISQSRIQAMRLSPSVLEIWHQILSWISRTFLYYCINNLLRHVSKSLYVYLHGLSFHIKKKGLAPLIRGQEGSKVFLLYSVLGNNLLLVMGQIGV